MAKARRVGKVFIDWSQNADYKTVVASIRSVPSATSRWVSLPVRWAELERAISTRNAESLYFNPATALRRLADAGDLYRPCRRQCVRRAAVSACDQSRDLSTHRQA
jgi:bifunctional non-homologous end joining protein LigD